MQINQDAICQFMIVVGSKFVMNTIELHYKNPFVGPILLELHFRSWKLRYIWLSTFNDPSDPWWIQLWNSIGDIIHDKAAFATTLVN